MQRPAYESELEAEKEQREVKLDFANLFTFAGSDEEDD
jgi:hypothetical protein